MSTIAPIHYLCVFGMREDWRLERRLRRAGINKQRLGTSLGQLAERDWRIPNPLFRLIFTSVFLGFTPPSYSFINATFRILMNMHKSFLCCFKGTSLVGEIGLNTFLFYCSSHLAAQRPVAKFWATAMVLFENIMEWVFGAFMLLITLYDETSSNGFIKRLLESWVFLLETDLPSGIMI